MRCGSFHERGQGLGNTQPGSGIPFNFCAAAKSLLSCTLEAGRPLPGSLPHCPSALPILKTSFSGPWLIS